MVKRKMLFGSTHNSSRKPTTNH